MTFFLSASNGREGRLNRAKTTGLEFDTRRGTPTAETGTGGAAPPINRTLGGSSSGGGGEFLTQVFDRIWVAPEALSARNPVLGIPIPVTVWNAYRVSNTLSTVDNLPDGVTVTTPLPVSFAALEQKDLVFTLTEDLAALVEETITLTFALGSRPFDLAIIAVEFLDIIPEDLVREAWTWKTDITTAWDGSEERISLNSSPRLSLEFGATYEDAQEGRQLFRDLFTGSPRNVLVPFWQYATPLLETTTVGGKSLRFNPVSTFVREGIFVLLVDETQDLQLIAQVDSMTSEGCTLSDVLTSQLGANNAIVVPMIESFLDEGSSLTIQTTIGQSRIQTRDVVPLTEFPLPAQPELFSRFAGAPLLSDRPLPNSNGRLETGKELLLGGADVSLRIADTGRKRPSFSITRRWAICRNIEYWRQILAEVSGQYGILYHPTFTDDLKLLQQPAAGSATLELEDSSYASLFWPHATFQQLWVQTNSGESFATAVTNASDNTITLDIAPNASQGGIARLSFLLKMRLSSETVRLDHFVGASEIEFGLITVDN